MRKCSDFSRRLSTRLLLVYSLLLFAVIGYAPLSWGYGQTHLDADRTLYKAGSALTAGLAADLLGKDAATAANAARNAAENNFLNHLDEAKLKALRAKKDLSREDAQLLVLLEIKDRFGDEFLAKLQGGQTLTSMEEKNLKIFLADYASVEGDKATAALIREKIVLDNSSYPFAGSREAKIAYKDDFSSGQSWWEWLTSWRPVSANEEAFNDAKRTSGWLTHPNELLLPTGLERLGWISTLDALRNSALASTGYVGAKALGIDEYNSSQLAQTLSALSDVGISLGLPKAGLGSAFGETTATVKPGAAKPGDNLPVPIGTAAIPKSPVILPGTTVALSEGANITLTGGKVVNLPKGSVVAVDVGMDTLSVVKPDGSKVMTRYSTAVAPVKALPGSVEDTAKIKFNADVLQLDRKFKHAADFGVVTTKKNPETLAQFESALQSHLNSSATVQQGTYRSIKDSKVFFNPVTNNAVVLDGGGNFVTGFKLIPGSYQFENFIKNGMLQ